MIKYGGVADGTVKGQPLCRSCTWADYRRGEKHAQQVLICKALSTGTNQIMPFEAFDCGSYDNKNLVGVYDMDRRAWILAPDKDGELRWVAPVEVRALRKEGALDYTPEPGDD